VVALERVDSTNDEARRQAGAGAASGTVIWARHQDAGRGRRGRHWESPEGNLQCSVLVRLDCALAVAAQLSLVAALAVAEAVEAVLPRGLGRVQLKWPNDVLVNGRKVAGILLESEPGLAGRLAWLVVGIGINLQQSPAGTPYPATALAAEGAPVIEPGAMLERLLGCFGERLDCWQRDGLAPIRTAWLQRAAGLGLPITVRLAHETLVGSFGGLDADGALLLLSVDSGEVQRVQAGDVFFPWLTGGPANVAKA
jgi:BirA family biotin operon repressor/biotin-[acetyl-CoA-carboxylase] ligase